MRRGKSRVRAACAVIASAAASAVGWNQEPVRVRVEADAGHVARRRGGGAPATRRATSCELGAVRGDVVAERQRALAAEPGQTTRSHAEASPPITQSSGVLMMVRWASGSPASAARTSLDGRRHDVVHPRLAAQADAAPTPVAAHRRHPRARW